MKNFLLATSLAIAASAPSFAADYFVVVPVKGRTAATAAIAVSLNSYSLPTAIVGKPYQFDLTSLLSVTGDPAYTSANVTWQLAAGSLPAGLSLGANGILSGTATLAATTPVTFKATYKSVVGSQDYVVTAVVSSAALSAESGYSANFGQVFIGKTAMQRFVLRNTGNLTLTALSSQLSGNPYARISSTSCGSTLAPAATCTYDIAYTPPSTDTLAASLTVSSPELASSANLDLTGEASNVLYAKGTPALPVFIKTTAGTAGTYLGTQVSTSQVPAVTGGYLGGGSVGDTGNSVRAISQVYRQSTTATTSTYLLGVQDGQYAKLLQVTITLNGADAYATLTSARYHTTALTTGPSTNILTLWNSGTNQTLTTTLSGPGYGVAGLTVVGY